LTLVIWGLSVLLIVLSQYINGGAIHLGFIATVAIAGCLCSTLIYWTASWARQRKATVKVLSVFAAVIVASLLLGLADAAIGYAFHIGQYENPIQELTRALRNILRHVWLNGLLGAVFVVVQSNRTVRERERQLAEAQALAARAELAASSARLAALRYQLNPHLLFNALNATSSLVLNRRNDEAEAMLAKLSDFLRSTLTGESGQAVALGRELEALETYLDIEAVRFGDRVRVLVEAPHELEDALVPSFLLQPLVENAVKYGVSPTSRTVSIRIYAAKADGDLVVTIEDDGDPAKAATVRKGTGVGLANVRQRLELLYGERASLAAEPLEQGFRATVRLPLEFFQPQRAEAA
jgi:sensor histidine kinase YesM